jgi:hypothetical protein
MGASLRILTGTLTSPTLTTQMQDFLTAFPGAKWHRYDPCGRHSARAGAMAAFGKPMNSVYRFDHADVIVSLDSDFLYSTCRAACAMPTITMPVGVRPRKIQISRHPGFIRPDPRLALGAALRSGVSGTDVRRQVQFIDQLLDWPPELGHRSLREPVQRQSKVATLPSNAHLHGPVWTKPEIKRGR